MRFRTVQLKSQDDDDWKRIEWRITYSLSLLDNFLTCNPLIGMQVGRFHNRLKPRSEEHTSELQSRQYLVCRLLLEKKKERTSICESPPTLQTVRPGPT